MRQAGDGYDAPTGVDRRIDLHLHSVRSDGRLEPTQVVAAAKAAGLVAVALTDHDTVAGIEEAAAAAAALELPLVPGLELSAYDLDRGSTHLLGYFIDPEHAELLGFLEEVRLSRLERAAAMVEKLNDLGLSVSLDAVMAEASPDGLVARPHVARALVDGGWVGSYGEAFSRFIAAGRPAYVPTLRVEPEEGIRWIHQAGGLAVLAHGGKTHGADVIRNLAAAGLDGLETLHPDHGPVEVRKLRRLAAELGLLETGGSDWHGPRDDRRGQLASQPVPYEWYERLKAAAAGAESERLR